VQLGETELLAAERRRKLHESRAGGSAAWLRCCANLRVEVLGTAGSLAQAALKELWHTCLCMDRFGRLLTRGGPWCRTCAPWEEVSLIMDFIQGQGGPSVDVFATRLKALGDPPRDVRLHLDGRCYICEKLGHLAAWCPRVTGKEAPVVSRAATAVSREARYAAHFVPTPRAVWWDCSETAWRCQTPALPPLEGEREC